MIRILDKIDYKKYPLEFKYVTHEYYDVTIDHQLNNMVVSFTRKPLETPMHMRFIDYLYEDYCYDSYAFGYYVNNQLAGVIEIDFEPWSKRARIRQCIVFDGFKRMGIGTKLMDYAKAFAKEKSARALILETQTCNTVAIDFYRRNGFELMGFDALCYTNEDLKRKEVRIELGLIF